MHLKQICNELDKRQTLCSFHELHGVLCGMLTVDMLTEFAHWTKEMERLGVDQKCFGGDAGEAWRRVFEDTAAQLKGGDLRFRPLLREDAGRAYTFRVQALADWCSGFIYGVGVSNPVFSAGLSASSKKFFADVSEISSADSDELRGDAQLANEAAYESVVEYLGLGVIMMCDESISGKAKDRLH